MILGLGAADSMASVDEKKRPSGWQMEIRTP